LTTTEWHHAVAVKKGADWTVYHDGEPAKLGFNRGWPFVGDVTFEVPLWIGCDHANVSSFKGCVDEVMVYERALSPEEIRQLFDLGRSAEQQKAPTPP
jgi:hypothetical protein